MSNWKQWVNAILGLIVLFYGYTDGNSVVMISGLLVAVVAIWAAMEKKAM